MSLTGNKSPRTIFGTFICRFHISRALSESNVPLCKYVVTNVLAHHVEGSLCQKLNSGNWVKKKAYIYQPLYLNSY